MASFASSTTTCGARKHAWTKIWKNKLGLSRTTLEFGSGWVGLVLCVGLVLGWGLGFGAGFGVELGLVGGEIGPKKFWSGETNLVPNRTHLHGCGGYNSINQFGSFTQGQV